MLSTKALPVLFSAVCLAASFIMVTSDCVDVKGQKNVNYVKILGRWYEGFLSQCKLDRASKWTFDLGLTSVQGSAIPKGSSGEEVKFKASMVIDQSKAQFTVNFPDTGSEFSTAWLSSTYTLVATDNDCFAVAAGCPKDTCSPLVFIWFREENPSKDCVDRANAAVSKARLQSYVVADPGFIKDD